MLSTSTSSQNDNNAGGSVPAEYRLRNKLFERNDLLPPVFIPAEGNQEHTTLRT
jgi:hypothetical protein